MKTHLDLFSGIGGFALAARWAGLQTIGFCEYENYPRRVLAKHWPGVPIHGDIRDLDGSAYKGVGLITGGYPCQPFSLAGQRKGTEDDRHLWPEMLRVVAQARPAWVIAENVAGHITMGLDQVLLDLEGEGYACRALVIPACAVDAPHRRDRVWIIAKNVADPRRKRCDTGPEVTGTVHGEFENGSSCNNNQRSGEVLADSNGSPAQGRRLSSGVCSEHSNADSSGDTVGREGPFKWLPEPEVGRVAHGIPSRVDRLRALGNAIVPQVAYQLIMSIQQVEPSEPAS